MAVNHLVMLQLLGALVLEVFSLEMDLEVEEEKIINKAFDQKEIAKTSKQLEGAKDTIEKLAMVRLLVFICQIQINMPILKKSNHRLHCPCLGLD